MPVVLVFASRDAALTRAIAGEPHRAVYRLTAARATQIFVEYYHQRPGLGALPESLQPSVFDMYVNAGANAVKVLQRLLTDMGFPCDPDGAIGPATIRAAQRARGHGRSGHDDLSHVDECGGRRPSIRHLSLGDIRERLSLRRAVIVCVASVEHRRIRT